MKYTDSPALRKVVYLVLYVLVAHAVSKGILPKEVLQFIKDHPLELMALLFGVGHIAPEAAKAAKAEQASTPGQ